MGKITKTVVLGSLIAGALALFSKTKQGKIWRKKLTAQAEDVYAVVLEHLKNVQEISRTNFEEVVDTVVKVHAKNKRLTTAEAKALSKELKQQWSNFKSEN